MNNDDWYKKLWDETIESFGKEPPKEIKYPQRIWDDLDIILREDYERATNTSKKNKAVRKRRVLCNQADEDESQRNP